MQSYGAHLDSLSALCASNLSLPHVMELFKGINNYTHHDCCRRLPHFLHLPLPPPKLPASAIPPAPYLNPEVLMGHGNQCAKISHLAHSVDGTAAGGPTPTL